MRVSERVQEVIERILQDQTQEEFSLASGVDAAIISRMRRYGKIPSRATVAKIASAAKLSSRRRAEFFAICGYVELAAEETAGALA